MTNRLLGVAEALTLREIVMNINQMKASIAKFRKADLSVIKDEKLRAKGQKLQGKEKGFTLLELLVVITLLAILATGALVAFDGAGEKAQASKAANTVAVLDQGVRAYKAVTQAYPNQWDNLADPVNAIAPMMSTGTTPINDDLQQILGSFDIAAGMVGAGVVAAAADLEDYFEDNFGMDELQHVFGNGVGANGVVEPNRLHNEGTNPPDGAGNGAVETEYGDFGVGALATGDPQYISILGSVAFEDDEDLSGAPNANAGLPMNCTVGGVDISNTWAAGAAGGANPLVLNSINDALSTERCNLVVAVGFGGDAAQSTVDAAAGVIQAPTYSSAEVNPAESYGRYIGLFLLASGEKGAAADGDTVQNLVASNFLARPRLLGFIDTQGNTLDANVASATQN
jgi:prepilin-type N-terminal cleavage/methylation domain-containing protein